MPSWSLAGDLWFQLAPRAVHSICSKWTKDEMGVSIKPTWWVWCMCRWPIRSDSGRRINRFTLSMLTNYDSDLTEACFTRTGAEMNCNYPGMRNTKVGVVRLMPQSFTSPPILQMKFEWKILMWFWRVWEKELHWESVGIFRSVILLACCVLRSLLYQYNYQFAKPNF